MINDIQECIQKWVTLALSLVYGWLVILASLLDIVRCGRSFFQVKRRPKPPQVLQDADFTHNFIKLNSSLKLHYVSSGNGNKPTVLMLHGFPEVWFSWRHQIKHLRHDFHVVAPDLRGYGDSDKPLGVENYTVDKLVEDVRELIEGLGKDRVILVGHDWGGALAYMFATKYPEKVEKLIVLNAPHFQHFAELLKSSWKQFFMSWYMIFFKLPYLPELRILANDLSVFDSIFVDENGAQIMSEEDIEVYKYFFSRPGAITGPLNYYRARYLRPAKPYLTGARITMPTLVIWGKKDNALSLVLATGCAKYIDNFSFRIIDNGTHFIQNDKPELVNRYISEFLSSEQ